jgi:hypothetical protein
MERRLAPVRHPPSASAPLAVLTELFDRLHSEDIRYCHWKSTEHLSASLAGRTDLDVLVDRKDARRLPRVLTDVGFKRFAVTAGYPGIEDYLGFDAETGTLSHLHVHYQLTLGEKFLKGYRLPWEDVALTTSTLDAEHGIYVIDPNLEALMLVTRATLKLRARDYLLAAAGYAYIRGGALRELRWLARRVDHARLHALALTLVGERATALLRRIVAAPQPSIRQLQTFRRSVYPSLDGYRLYGAMTARLHRWARECGWAWVAVWSRFRGIAKRSTRTAPQGGLAVTITGPQPQATTLAKQLVAWLSPEMAVVPDVGGGGGAHPSRGRRARGRGLIVVADRLHDGPEARRPDLTLNLCEPSTGGAGRSRRFGQSAESRTIDLDMRNAAAMVLLQAKRAIWESI